MKRSCREVSRWTTYLRAESAGIVYADDSDKAPRRLSDEVFDRLLNGPAENIANPKEWHVSGRAASEFHQIAESMPEFVSLAAQTRGDVAASAAATEKLIPMVEAAMKQAAQRQREERERRRQEKAKQPQPQPQPNQPQPPPPGAKSDPKQGQPGQPGGEQQGEQGQPGKQPGQNGQPGEQNQPGQPGGEQGQPGAKGEGQGQGKGEGKGEGKGQGEGAGEGQGQGSGQGQQASGRGGSGAGKGGGSSHGSGGSTSSLGNAPSSCFDHDAIREQLRSGLKSAEQSVEDVREAIEALDGTGIGCGSGSGVASFKRALEVANRLRNDPRLKKIAELAGKFRRIGAEKRRTLAKHGAEIATEVAMGDEVTDLIPDELLKLIDPDFSLSTLRDVADGRALVDKFEGEAEMGKGPIVLLVDKSGSMSYRNKDAWATAIAIALMDHARVEKRPFAVAGFDSHIMFSEVVMPGDEMSDSVTCHPCGGTDLNRALSHGLELIKKASDAGQPLRKADIILITDGLDGTDLPGTAKIRAMAKEMKVTIQGIGIGLGPDAAVAMGYYVDTFRAVDERTVISGTLSDEVAESLFGEEVKGEDVEVK